MHERARPEAQPGSGHVRVRHHGQDRRLADGEVADPMVLQSALTTWAQAHAARVAAAAKGLRRFAVDGRSLRGAAGKGCRKPHVLGVLDVTAAVFLTQRQIDARSRPSWPWALADNPSTHCGSGGAAVVSRACPARA